MKLFLITISIIYTFVVNAETLKFRHIDEDGAVFELYQVSFSNQSEIGEYRFTYKKPGTTPNEGLFKNRLSAIEDLRLYNRKAIIVGTSGKSETISIIDLNAMKEVDRVQSYDAEISPSGMFVIYTKFYSRSSTAPEVLLVYDVEKTPEQNRFSQDFPSITPSVLNTDPYISSKNAGYPVYPVPGVYDSYKGSNDPKSFVGIGQFVWSSDEKELAFLSKTGVLSKKIPYETTLVRSDLSNGLSKVVNKEVKVSDYIPDDTDVHLRPGRQEIFYKPDGTVVFIGEKPKLSIHIPPV